MVTLRFTNSYGSVDLNCIVVYGTYFTDKRWAQSTQRLASGKLRTYDTGMYVVEGEIKCKNVFYDNGEQFRNWLRNHAVFQLNEFDIIVPDGIDLGNGKGVDLTGVKLTTNNDKDIFKYNVPGIYELKIPYTYVRS